MSEALRVWLWLAPLLAMGFGAAIWLKNRKRKKALGDLRAAAERQGAEALGERFAPAEGPQLLDRFRPAGQRYFAPPRPPCFCGERLRVEPEPENLHDCNALCLRRRDGTPVGYVPRRQNTIPAMLMRSGWRLWAEICQSEVGGKLAVCLYAQEGEEEQTVPAEAGAAESMNPTAAGV